MNSIRNLLEPEVYLRAFCQCGRYHDIKCHPDQMLPQMESWTYKHSSPGCKVEFVKVKHRVPSRIGLTLLKRAERLISRWFQGRLPWYLDNTNFKENTNYQAAFVASAALTFTSLASLGNDSTLIVGASSAVVDNGASGALLDLAWSGILKTGTSPTSGNNIYMYPWSKIDDSTYPDAVTGSDAAISMTSVNVLNGAFPSPRVQTVDGTSNRQYPQAPVYLSSFFGGIVRYWGLWVNNASGVALNASGSSFTQKASYIAS